MAHEKTSSQKREVRLHSERQEALRQGPKRQVQCSQLKGYRESKGLGVGKNEVVLERGIFRKNKILSQPPAEKEGPSPTELHSTCAPISFRSASPCLRPKAL